MFQDVMAAIREQTVVTLFHLEVRKQRTGADGGAVELSTPQRPAFLKYTAPDEDGTPRAAVESEPRVSSDDDAADAESAPSTGDPDADGATSAGEGANRAQRRGKSSKGGGKTKRGKRR